MSERLNLAIVGLGYWGPNHLKTYQNLSDVCVTKVCDRQTARWNKISSQYPSVQFVDDIQDVLADKAIKAVVIVTDADTHYVLAKKCLEQGKDVFVEKPLALSSLEAEELICIAKKINASSWSGICLSIIPRLWNSRDLFKIMP